MFSSWLFVLWDDDAGLLVTAVDDLFIDVAMPVFLESVDEEIGLELTGDSFADVGARVLDERVDERLMLVALAVLFDEEERVVDSFFVLSFPFVADVTDVEAGLLLVKVVLTFDEILERENEAVFTELWIGLLLKLKEVADSVRRVDDSFFVFSSLLLLD